MDSYILLEIKFLTAALLDRLRLLDKLILHIGDMDGVAL